MIKAVILENEISAQQALIKMLELTDPDIKIIKVFAKVKEISSYLKKHSVDLVFLDIEVDDGNSFELFDDFPVFQFNIIFTTAFYDYGYKAFKVNAIDYLLKPIDIGELSLAIQKVKNQIKANELQSYFSEKIILKTLDENIVVPISTIIRLEADGAYTTFVTETRKIVVSKNIKHYESLLPVNAFVRCHHSHLISVSKIIAMKGDQIKLSNGDNIPVSHRKKAQVLKYIS